MRVFAQYRRLSGVRTGYRGRYEFDGERLVSASRARQEPGLSQ
jgi:hypothetical protein